MADEIVDIQNCVTEEGMARPLEEAIKLCASNPHYRLILEVRDSRKEEAPAGGCVEQFDVEGVDFSKFVIEPFYRSPRSLPDQGEGGDLGEH